MSDTDRHHLIVGGDLFASEGGIFFAEKRKSVSIERNLDEYVYSL